MPARGLDYLCDPDRKERLETRLRPLVTPLLGIMAAAGYAAASIDHRSVRPSKVLIHQRRVGADGRLLTVPKVRTLPDTPEAASRSVGAFNQLASSIGHVLRITGLDEAVQYKLLGNGMHLVGGYRPMLPRDVAREADAVSELRKRPGWHNIAKMFEENQEARTVTEPSLLGLAPLYGHYKLGRVEGDDSQSRPQAECAYSDEEITLYKMGARIALENMYYYSPEQGANEAVDLRILADAPRVLLDARKGSASISAAQPWLPAERKTVTPPTVLTQYMADVQQALPFAYV